MSAVHARAGQADGRLLLAFLLSVITLAAELVGGFLSGSLALLSDAGHVMMDCVALGTVLLAVRLSRRPADARRTFGYRRLDVLGAQANGVLLTVASILILRDATPRLFHPQPVQPGLMLVIACIGLALNGAVAMLLAPVAKQSLAARASMLHVVGDLLSSVGVLIAGFCIVVAGWYRADAAIAICISVWIGWQGFRMVRRASSILIGTVPAHIRIEELYALLASDADVLDVHHIHLITHVDGLYELTAHVVVPDQPVSSVQRVCERLKALLEERFAITHCTLEAHTPTLTAVGATPFCGQQETAP